MPEIYNELTAPTAVTHSLRINFTSPTTANLIVAKTTLLQIFTLTTHATELLTSPITSSANDRRVSTASASGNDEEQGDFAADVALQRSTVEDVSKLVLIAEYPLHGQTSGMVAIQRPGGAPDALLVSFREAKASLLVWDPDTCGMQTVSLHYYERQEFWSPVVVTESTRTELVVDPGNRAALLRFAGDMIAVWPIWQEGEEDLLDADGDEDTKMGDGAGSGGDGGVLEGEEDDDWDPTAEEKPKVEEEEEEEVVMKDADSTPKKEKGKSKREEQIFHPSFVIKASLLDDSISHVVSMTFLHEYREPTLGILYSPKRTWTGWLEERKDTFCYMVITLDLEQRACTPIMSVQGLPYDLFKVVPLNTPIGGSLLLGTNALIHVDQAGKTTGVAVNPFYKKSTNFGGLADQGDLCLSLEGASIVELENENGDLLLILRDGTAVIVSFRMDGRNVSGVRISRIANHIDPIVGGVVTSATVLSNKRLFIACAEGDARILKWKRMGEKKKAKQSKLESIKEDDNLDDVDLEDAYAMLSDDDDDDLYGTSGPRTDLSGAPRKDSFFPPTSPTTTGGSRTNTASGEYFLQTHDRLLNLAPLGSVTLGRPLSGPSKRVVAPELEIVATCGPSNTPEDAGLAILRRSLAPTVVGGFELPAAKALWAVRTKTTKDGPEGVGAEEEYARYLFVSRNGESSVFRVNGDGEGFEELGCGGVEGGDFESEGETVEVGDVGGGALVCQVVQEQVRVYDCDMQLAQIIPMIDEETGEDGPAIVKAKVGDPYVLLLRVDGSANVYKLDKNMELAEQDMGALKEGRYGSGCLYQAKKGQFYQAITTLGEDDEEFDYILIMLTEQGALEMYNLADLSAPIFVASNFGSLPPLLKAGSPAETRTEDITEILLADLGDHVTKEPYLLVRNGHDDITFYKSFFTATTSQLSFAKIPNPTLATPRASSIPTDIDDGPTFLPMVAAPNVGGYATVFLPGNDPAFILKTAHSVPRLHRLYGAAVRSFDSFHTRDADRGFIYVDVSGTVRVAQLPSSADDAWNFSSAFSCKKVYLNESLRAVAWFDPMQVYAAATTKRVPFSLEDDDGMLSEEAESEQTLHPQIDSSSLVLINPRSWSIVDRHSFTHNEVVYVVTTPSLEVSENTHERRTLITVGTGIHRGEDHSARGAIYVFEVIEVVPEPGRPETNRKLKLLVREEVKGTVSALTGVSNGYLLAAQGQKLMVRGLKEDGSLLPVAFMDVNCYLSSVRCLDGMVLVADFVKSVWFAGFGEEPYKMTLFGKDAQDAGVVAAEFLPEEGGGGGRLLFVVADARGQVLVLEYDPEHPKSLSGQRLIRRAAFATGHEISTLTLLPRTPLPLPPITTAVAGQPPPQPQVLYTVLISTRTGLLATLSTTPENSHRRLNILQNQIISNEEHAAGLNPKAFRHVEGTHGFRGVLDAGVVERWCSMGVGRRREVGGKAGFGRGAGRREVVETAGGGGGGGLGYL